MTSTNDEPLQEQLPLEPPRLVRTDATYKPPHIRRRITQDEEVKEARMRHCTCLCMSCIAEIDQGNRPLHA